MREASFLQGDVLTVELPTAAIVYSDPPYGPIRGQRFAYGQIDTAGLIERMTQLREPDGCCILHCSSPQLPQVLARIKNPRVLAWCKNFTVWKPGMAFQYCWEPIVLWYGPKFRHPKSRRYVEERDWLVIDPVYRRNGPPTQKPKALIRHALTRLVKPSRRFLDLCCGVGTAAHVASEMGMEAIGIDVEPWWEREVATKT